MEWIREYNYDTQSTEEIKRYRNKELKKEREEMEKNAGEIPEELSQLTPQKIQKYVLDAENFEALMCNLFLIKSMQNKRVEPLYFEILEAHGLVNFGEQLQLGKLFRENVQHSQFMDRLIRYMAVYIYNESKLDKMLVWTHLFAVKQEIDWTKRILNTAGAKNIECELLTALVILIPPTATKHAMKVFSLMTQEKEVPACFEFFASTAFRCIKLEKFNKSDVTVMAERFFKKAYDASLELTSANDDVPKTEVTKAQAKFIDATHSIANDVFTVIQEKDRNGAIQLLQNPNHEMEKPSDLFIEFILQFAKLGMFTKFEDKIIAWNYYYDDRWCGYDRADLFGTDFVLTERFKYEQAFKFVGAINKHPHDHNLSLFARAIDWMLNDDALYEKLMKKYGDEKFIHYAAIALSFTGRFEKMITFYGKVKEQATSKHAYMSLNICYMYSLAKKGSALEAFRVWSAVQDRALEWGFTDSMGFARKKFDLPAFVNIKYTGQFATRLLRNCLWTAALAEGTGGWKKYGLIILNLCETLEDSFVNHNMPRVMLQKMSPQDLEQIFTNDLESCIEHRTTFNYIMSAADLIDPTFLASLREKGIVVPHPTKFPKPIGQEPGYKEVYLKLKNKHSIFAHIQADLSEEVYQTFKEPRVDEDASKMVSTPQKNESDAPRRRKLVKRKRVTVRDLYAYPFLLDIMPEKNAFSEPESEDEYYSESDMDTTIENVHSRINYRTPIKIRRISEEYTPPPMNYSKMGGYNYDEPDNYDPNMYADEDMMEKPAEEYEEKPEYELMEVTAERNSTSPTIVEMRNSAERELNQDYSLEALLAQQSGGEAQEIKYDQNDLNDTADDLDETANDLDETADDQDDQDDQDYPADDKNNLDETIANLDETVDDDEEVVIKKKKKRASADLEEDIDEDLDEIGEMMDSGDEDASEAVEDTSVAVEDASEAVEDDEVAIKEELIVKEEPLDDAE